jgi:hypothetical protein
MQRGTSAGLSQLLAGLFIIFIAQLLSTQLSRLQ